MILALRLELDLGCGLRLDGKRVVVAKGGHPHKNRHTRIEDEVDR